MTEAADGAAIAARLEELEARLAIIELEATYARAWDLGDGDRWAAVFSEDGVFEIAPAGDRPGSSVQGRERLSAYCREFNAHTSGVHLMHLPAIRFEGDRAYGGLAFEYRFVRRLPTPETISGTTAGHYEVTYVRLATGWCMTHRLEKPIVRDNRSFFTV